MKHGLLLGMAMILAMSLPAVGGSLENPDSIIIGNASYLTGQTQVSVPVYFVTHGDVTFYNLPLKVESAGGIKFQGHAVGEALGSWDDNWQGLNNGRDEALQMGFADLGGEDNPSLNTSGRRVEAFRLIFTVAEDASEQSAAIAVRDDQRAGGPLFGYSDGVSSVAPVVVSGGIGLGRGGNALIDPLPTGVSLSQNFPNPFNPSTEIEFALPDARQVKLTVFNLLGQEVRGLVSGMKEAGYHKITWDGKSDNGQVVPSGTYFYRLDAGDFTQSRKMVMLK